MLRDDEIFGEALDLPAGERAAYLERACAGDPMRRKWIETLLAEEAQAGDFLQPRLEWEPERAAVAGEKTGDTIGRYVLKEQIGEGGCGIVYRAEQRTPVRRDVALKVIKPGMDSRSVVARFEAERQALALMDHPGIARVFDAGTTESGRPYFVMELVAGAPITLYCDQKGLPLAARLELFVAVCLAVQHAHQKGVIHRDLKPSNILVAEHDGAPLPKVIDFGIAKATQGRLSDDTVHTGLGQFIGTPTYMSPEQAELGATDIDTRSDIYSLGALLYRLLTGRTPLDPGTAGLAETWRMIREVDPPRPSVAVAALPPAERARVAQWRGTTPAHLASALRGDLDWIAMRCLEKNRARRYGTAQDLAEDVRHHLRHEPVMAGPPGAWYRTGKFIRRHRAASLAVAGIAAAMIGGTVVSVQQAVRARRAERQALADRDAATGARQAEAEARTDAQRRQEQAEDALTYMLGNFRTELKKVGRLDLLNDVGGKALAYFDALPARDLTDTALARQAKALTQIGEIRMDQREFPEAERVFTTAYERAAALAARHPTNGDMLFERGQAEFWIGAVRRKRGDLPGAGEWMGRYRDTGAALVALDPSSKKWQAELVSGHHNLAALELDRGNLAAARTGFLAERSTVAALLAATPKDVDLQFKLTNIDSWLGDVADRSGDLAEAVERYTRAREGLETLVKNDPRTAQWSYRLADTLMWEAEELAITGENQQAEARLALIRKTIDPLIERDPSNRRWLLASLDCVVLEAAMARARGRPEQGIDKLEGVLPQLEQLAKADPSDVATTRRLLIASWRTADLRQERGRTDAAAAATRAVELADGLAKTPTLESKTIGDCAQAFVTAARIFAATGPPEKARLYAERALDQLLPHLAHATDWHLLDPAVRAYVLCDRWEEAHTLADRLHAIGYQPLEPWPSLIARTP